MLLRSVYWSWLNEWNYCLFYEPKCLHSGRVEDDLGVVVEEDANAVVGELVAEAVLVRVVYPTGHPIDGAGSRMFDFAAFRIVETVGI